MHKITNLSNRSPNESDWSQFNGWKMSSSSKIFETPFLNNGIVHAKVNIDKIDKIEILDFSRGFGGNFRRDDSILWNADEFRYIQYNDEYESNSVFVQTYSSKLFNQFKYTHLCEIIKHTPKLLSILKISR